MKEKEILRGNGKITKEKDYANATLIWGLISLITLGALIFPEILGIIYGFKTMKKGTTKKRRTIVGIGMSVLTSVLIVWAMMLPTESDELEVGQDTSYMAENSTENNAILDENKDVSNLDAIEQNTIIDDVVTETVTEVNNEQVVAIFSDTYRKEYIECNDIKIIDFKKENKSLDKFILKLEELIPIKEESNWGNSYYARTNDYTELYYAGEMKDNRPHGTGCIYEVISSYYTNRLSELDTEVYVMRVYEGEFKKGVFDGYGRMYYPVDSSLYVMSEYEIPYESGLVIDNYVDVAGEVQENIIRSVNPLKYEGEFNDGEYSGEGNYYEYILEMDGSLRIAITSGEFKDGKTDGSDSYYCHYIYCY